MDNNSCTREELDAGMDREAARLDAIEAGNEQAALLRGLPLPFDVIFALKQARERLLIAGISAELCNEIRRLLDSDPRQ